MCLLTKLHWQDQVTTASKYPNFNNQSICKGDLWQCLNVWGFVWLFLFFLKQTLWISPSQYKSKTPLFNFSNESRNDNLALILQFSKHFYKLWDLIERILLQVGWNAHHLFAEVHWTREPSQPFLKQIQCLGQICAVALMASSRKDSWDSYR